MRAEVLAPFFWAIFRARTRQEREWCYPPGPAVVRVEGSDPIRILIIGDGPAAGCGVLLQELGVAGFLARHVAEETGRGVEVTVDAEPTASARSTLDRLGTIDLRGYDSIVLMLAATDALCLTGRRNWQQSMTRLIDALTSTGTHSVVVTSAASIELSRWLSPLGRRITGRHARVLNTATSLVCARSRVPMVSLDQARVLTACTYAKWGSSIGARLCRALAVSRRHP